MLKYQSKFIIVPLLLLGGSAVLSAVILAFPGTSSALLPTPEYYGVYILDGGTLIQLDKCPAKENRLEVKQCCFLAEKVKVRNTRPIFIIYMGSYEEGSLKLNHYTFEDFSKGLYNGLLSRICG